MVQRKHLGLTEIWSGSQLSNCSTLKKWWHMWRKEPHFRDQLDGSGGLEVHSAALRNGGSGMAAAFPGIPGDSSSIPTLHPNISWYTQIDLSIPGGLEEHLSLPPINYRICLSFEGYPAINPSQQPRKWSATPPPPQKLCQQCCYTSAKAEVDSLALPMLSQLCLHFSSLSSSYAD